MSSFGSDLNKPRDTKIPSEHVPLILLHWLYEYYYGGRITVREMRAFLETKLRSGYYTRDAVKTWIRSSECWEQQMELYNPGSVAELLAEYFEVKIAA